jgi:hypothetical protein
VPILDCIAESLKSCVLPKLYLALLNGGSSGIIGCVLVSGVGLGSGGIIIPDSVIGFSGMATVVE